MVIYMYMLFTTDAIRSIYSVYSLQTAMTGHVKSTKDEDDKKKKEKRLKMSGILLCVCLKDYPQDTSHMQQWMWVYHQ